MKKLILLAAIAFGVVSANAEPILQPKLWENWSVGLDAGTTTPLKHAAFWGDMRPILGLTVKKQITPTFGLGAETQFTINTSTWRGQIHSKTMFDNSYVGVFGTVDLFNLFGGYKCKTRVFSVEAMAGTGWGHTILNKLGGHIGYAHDNNYLAAKVGLNFNFNCSDHITLAVKPSLGWNLNGKPHGQSPTDYDANYGVFSIQAGLVWHLSGHNFECVRPYNQSEVDALNAQINDLRAAIDAALANNAAWEAKAAGLADEIAACMNRKPEVVEVVKKVDTNSLESVRYVFFRLGSSVITSDQMPNVEMIANYLKNHKDSKVIVKGYASKDGSLEFNIKLAKARAESVRNSLINKYGIKANRIQAEGQGIGEMFTEESWNRVAICTIED